MGPFHLMRSARGFTLIEIVVVLLIFGVVIAMAAAITRGVVAAQKRSLTVTRLATVDAAIIQFVAVQKRMPCPADGRLASTDNNAGLETAPNGAAGCDAQQHGVVPWRALGLTEQEVTDGWDRRLTYRVQALLGVVAPAGMDMSQCDPAGTEGGIGPKACTAGCTSANLAACTPPLEFLRGKGLLIKTVAGVNVMDPALVPPTGAAYVVISAGESGGGAYNNNGMVVATITTDGDEEKNRNYANLVVQPHYIDDSISDVAGVAHFDDLVSRPSVHTVVNKAGLGPRSH